mmetsp:Transcript_87628/g.233311  ORF Transcript_87628/g.233311 Transcript_87628/m.233311 type:complete len:156 (+) Transcript_87628:631-1098(+)
MSAAKDMTGVLIDGTPQELGAREKVHIGDAAVKPIPLDGARENADAASISIADKEAADNCGCIFDIPAELEALEKVPPQPAGIPEVGNGDRNEAPAFATWLLASPNVASFARAIRSFAFEVEAEDEVCESLWECGVLEASVGKFRLPIEGIFIEF